MTTPTPAERTPGQHDGAEGTSTSAGSTAATTTGGPPRRAGVTRLGWLLAAATFVAGLLIGTLTAGGGADGEEATGEPVAAEPTDGRTGEASPPPDAAVTVPASCLEVADSAEQLVGLVRDAAEAAGQLDAAALSAIVRQLEQSQVRLDAQSTDCRAGGPLP